jgi:hypothetical protein
MKENERNLRYERMEISRELREIVEQIDFHKSGCDFDCDCSNQSFQKAIKKAYILQLLFIEAFSLGDLDILKTLNKEYLECFSDFKPLFNKLLKELAQKVLEIENYRPGPMEHWGISREMLRGNELKKQETLIEFLEYYQSHHYKKSIPTTLKFLEYYQSHH